MAGEEDRVAFAPVARHEADVCDEADAADLGRRVDRPALRLVVERDVSRHDRPIERLARLRDSLDRLCQLPADLAPLGVAEVEAVREGERLAARAGDVARRFEDGGRAAGPRGEPAQASGAVERNGKSAYRRPQAQDGGVEAGPPDRARADQVVVAVVDPRAAADVRGAQELQQRLLVLRALRRPYLRRGRTRHARDLVARGFLRQEIGGDRAHNLAFEVAPKLAGVGDHPDLGRRELPALAYLLDALEERRAGDSDHALLAFGDHDLPRLHPLLA